MSQVIMSNRSNVITTNPINSSPANYEIHTDFDPSPTTVFNTNLSNDNHVNNTGVNFRATGTESVDTSSTQERSFEGDTDNNTISEQGSIQGHDSNVDAGVYHNTQTFGLSNLSFEEMQMIKESRQSNHLPQNHHGNCQQNSFHNGHFHHYGPQNLPHNSHFYHKGGSQPFLFREQPPFHSGGSFVPPYGYQMHWYSEHQLHPIHQVITLEGVLVSIK